jgi:hypothetical protein
LKANVTFACRKLDLIAPSFDNRATAEGSGLMYDIVALVRRFEADRDGRAPDLAWLRATAVAPAPFWQDLLDAHAASRAPRARSRYGERYELYADMVVRHLDLRTPAFRWVERGALQELSYAEVHARASRLAGTWAGQKVERGDVVAVVLPIGPAWLCAVLTALRMGLVVSWLPPVGSAFLARRLKKLAPKRIATDPAYLPILAGFEELVLQDGPGVAYPAQWHAYEPKEVCAVLFSPLREPLDTPLPLHAEAAYSKAVRDAIFAYRLAPGASLGAPGFDDLQHQPALAFSALLSGGTYVHLETADIQADPRCLTDTPFRALGLSVAVRDALLAAGARRGASWEGWFKNPEEPLDVDAWRAALAALGMEKTPAMNLVVESAAGGALLLSARRPGAADLRMVPAPGTPWGLYDLSGSGDEAPGALGLFAPKPSEKPAAEGHVVLSAWGPEHLYAGTSTPRRAGRVYPAQEVEEAVAGLSFVAGAQALPVTSGGAASFTMFVLVVFTGTTPAGPAAPAAIERAITDALGRSALPDRVVFYPLYPRLEAGKVDRAWGETQYRTGLLGRKARSPVIAALTALRGRTLVEA